MRKMSIAGMAMLASTVATHAMPYWQAEAICEAKAQEEALYAPHSCWGLISCIARTAERNEQRDAIKRGCLAEHGFYAR